MNTHQDDENSLIARQKDHLVAHEYITGVLGGDPTPAPSSDDDINDRYERGEVRVVTEQGRYPLGSISQMLQGENYKLDPEYQRRHRWNRVQKSRLIESFIMNVPVPAVFLYEWDYNQYEVMDGLQRMTAVREFYDDEFALDGLEYWMELEGKKYSELPSRIRAGIDRRYISSVVLLKETKHGDDDPERLKRFVFGRINTGGVQLSAQELRNALHDGPMNSLCRRLSRNENLRRMLNIPVNVEQLLEPALKAESPGEAEKSPESSLAPKDGDSIVGATDVDGVTPPEVPEAYRNMTDVELVLRFFANRQRMMHYRHNLRGYMDDYLRAANEFPQDTLDELERIFNETAELAYSLFAEDAFKRIRDGRQSNVPSTSIYDALMNILSRHLDDKEELLSVKQDIVSGLPSFYEENREEFNLRGQSRAQVSRRERKLEDYLVGHLSD